MLYILLVPLTSSKHLSIFPPSCPVYSELPSYCSLSLVPGSNCCKTPVCSVGGKDITSLVPIGTVTTKGGSSANGDINPITGKGSVRQFIKNKYFSLYSISINPLHCQRPGNFPCLLTGLLIKQLNHARFVIQRALSKADSL